MQLSGIIYMCNGPRGATSANKRYTIGIEKATIGFSRLHPAHLLKLPPPSHPMFNFLARTNCRTRGPALIPRIEIYKVRLLWVDWKIWFVDSKIFHGPFRFCLDLLEPILVVFHICESNIMRFSSIPSLLLFTFCSLIVYLSILAQVYCC